MQTLRSLTAQIKDEKIIGEVVGRVVYAEQRPFIQRHVSFLGLSTLRK